MKRVSLIIAALLCCSHAFSQEAESGENTFQFIPRIDLNPYTPLKEGGYKGFDLSNTSLYTLIEGGIGDSDFSYSIEGHLLSSDPSSLYSNTFRSDESNWLDWANITYTKGSWDFTVGKDILSMGTFELDEYDFDSHIDLSSTVWNNLAIYQWAAKAGWTSADESTYFAFQAATSPFGAKPFNSGLYSYSLYWSGELGPLSYINSVNAIQYDKKSYVGVVAAGLKLPVSDFEFGMDVITRGYDWSFNENSIFGTLAWNPSESLSITLKGGLENTASEEDVFGWDPTLDGEDAHDYFVPASLMLMNTIDNKNYLFGGAAIHYSPLENLRLHAVAACNNWSKSLSLNFGVTYYFDVRSIFGR